VNTDLEGKRSEQGNERCIGKAPGWDNVYLATGGAHKGILLSPTIGRAIADLMTASTTTLAIAPCAPERFTAVSA
jgi:D-amino-acid dehydrogenase